MALPYLGDPATTAAAALGIDPNDFSDLIDVNAQVPRTRTVTSHAFSIRMAGRLIGAVHVVGETATRQIDEEFDVNVGNYGHGPAALVPQNTGGRQLSIRRYDLYTARMEDVFSVTGEYVNLADQANPFSLRTVWRSPLQSSLGGRRVYEYRNCWFTNVGRQVSADDDRVVSVDATIAFQTKIRIQ